MYDPTSGTFSLVGSVIAGRAVAAASLLPNGNFLVVGGEFNGNSPFQTTVEMYTPGADGGAGTFSSVGMVPGVAGYGYAFPLPGGKVLVNGAFTNLGTVSLFDPSTSAFAQAPADLISGGNGLLLESGDVFFATGYPGGSGGAHTTQTELYQSATGTWKHTGNMSSAHHVPGMAELPNGNVLVVGGLDNSNSTLDVVEACSP
jgi:N-acetylneuraminic acid mutarotase